MIRIITGCVLFFTVTLSSVAQPSNDDCDGAIDLGTVPSCTDSNELSNVSATSSIISTSGSDAPPCFNGGQADRDVWYSFQVPYDISNVTITVQGEADNLESILQPQVALYRGVCALNQLNFLACASSQPGERRSRLDVFNLVAGQRYYLRVNDYSQSASPNSGRFQICLSEFSSVFTLGSGDEFTEACSGTLFDSGGPAGDYDNSENHVFTICPTDFTNCIALEFESLALEPGLDELTIYEGTDVTGNVVATASALFLENDYRIAANSSCVTVAFQSDASVVNRGFELRWSCQAQSCPDSAPDNADPIAQLPFSVEGVDVCEDYSSIGSNVCPELGKPLFLGGPDYFFLYEAVGNQCVDIDVNSTEENTGLAIFLVGSNGEIRRCLDAAPHGILRSVPLDDGESYLIALANASGCFQFDLDITQTDNCILNPSLDNALCNPFNTCFDLENENRNSRFFFEDSLVDFTIIQDINSGCWAQDIDPDNNQIEDANFYWFTLKAFADGNIGFFVNSLSPSDIDFNVWGPFSEDLVCNNPDSVKQIMARTQPIRSSWAGDDIPTGLADIHPITGVPVFDDYDCDFPITGSEGDGFVRTIPAKAGEHYVFLFNDYDGNVDDRGLIVDWSPMSDESILSNSFDGLMHIDTTICSTDTFFLDFLMPDLPLNIDPPTGVSCQSCDNPFILPSDSINQYKITLQGQCSIDTLMLRLEILEDNLPDTLRVCSGQEVSLDIEVDNSEAVYNWTGETDSLSCTDCPTPFFQTSEGGTYFFQYSVDLPNCGLVDSIEIIVDDAEGPEYEIISDTLVCEGTNLRLGGTDLPNNSYTWLLNDSLISNEANPEVVINQSDVYVLEVSNDICPYIILDSVEVQVARTPIINVVDDLTICEGDTIVLNQNTVQDDIDYTWSSSNANNVLDPSDGRGILVPEQSGTYTLRAVRGPCVVSESVEIEVIPSSIIVLPDQDTLLTCLGDTIGIEYQFSPASAMPFWVNARTGDTLEQQGLEIIADKTEKFYAYSESNGCPVVDSIVIRVDSLPPDLGISPSDTSVCEGSTVILTSPDFDPAIYEMVYQWTPTDGAQTGDSLYNLVIQPFETTTYFRISRTGACIDTSAANVVVNPLPVIDIMPQDTVICPGEPVQLNATVDPPDATLMWTADAGLSCSDCPDPVVNPSTTTTYTLEADNNGCPTTAEVTVNVETDAPPFNPPSDLIVCEGDLLALNPNEVEEFEYSWTSEDPNFNQEDIRNPIVQPPVGLTRYTVMVTDTSSKCSMASYDFTVFVPVLEDLPDIIYCDSSQVVSASAQFVNVGTLPSNIRAEFNWSTGQSDASIDFTPAQLGSSELILQVNVDGCTSQATVRVQQVEFEAELIGTLPDSARVLVGAAADLRLDLIIDERDDIFNIEWFENGESIATNTEVLNGVELPSGDRVVYSVVISTDVGCRTELFLTYFPIPFQLPNAFSPNNDNQNDLFNIVGLEDLSEQLIIEEFKVFSRWGTLVYDNESPQTGWDGTDGANDLPADTYKYIVRLRLGESVTTRQGEINLIR